MREPNDSPPVPSARTVTRYRIEIGNGTIYTSADGQGAYVRWGDVDRLLTALAEQDQEIARLKASRDEYKALASVGTWHQDCRPNRRKAAEEIQKSQARIDAIATENISLTARAEAAEAARGVMQIKLDSEQDKQAVAYDNLYAQLQAAEAPLGRLRRRSGRRRRHGTVVLGERLMAADPLKELLAVADQLVSDLESQAKSWSRDSWTPYDEAAAGLRGFRDKVEAALALREPAGVPQPPDDDRTFGQDYPRLKGRCPNCGNETLFRGSKGYITCSWLKCSAPAAAHDLLDRTSDDVAAGVPPPDRELCKDDNHHFGACTICGMPYLASRLEPPTPADLVWAEGVVAAIHLTNAPDEEVTPHSFDARTADLDELWCTGCAYHRDHPIHTTLWDAYRQTR